MNIKSIWTITLGGYELLASGDMMLAEPSLSHDHPLQTRPLLRAAAPAIHHRGNVVHNMTVSKVFEFEDQTTMRRFLLAHNMEVAALRPGAMSVVVDGGGDPQQFGRAAIASCRIPNDMTTMRRARVAVTYEIVATV